MLIDFSKEQFDIIIQAGQSNAEGWALGPVSAPFAVAGTPQPEWHHRLWQMDFNYVLKEQVWTSGGEYHIAPAGERIAGNEVVGNFAPSFAARYLAECLAPGRKILIIRAAVGGTGFAGNRWKTGDDLFENMMEMIRTALTLNPGNRAAALLWHQGENEVGCGASGDYYYEHLSALVGAVRKECGADLSFIAGNFVEEWRRKDPAALKNGPAISGALRRFCDKAGNARFVETDGLKSNNEATGNGDTIHFSREAQYILGGKYFDTFLEIKAAPQGEV